MVTLHGEKKDLEQMREIVSQEFDRIRYNGIM